MESGCDSGWSWVVLTCVLLSQVAMGGICLTGGVMYVIIERQFGENPVGNFWLCAMPFTMWFLSPPLGSFLTNRYGYRVCGLVGTCAASLGLMLSFFVKHRDPLFATYGFLTGFGLGIHYTSGYAALNDYFDKYKVLATGIASIGNNVGLVAFSKLISALIAAVTFEIVGFENFADGMGLVMPFKSFGNLIGGPLG
ncbi:MT12B-like protein, partial [Mya arenaria]